jgi:hypothetical protein
MNTVSLGLINTGAPYLTATVNVCLAANVAPPAPVAVSAIPIFPYLEKVTPERVAVPLWWSTRVRVAGEPAGGKAAVITGAGLPVVVTRNEFKNTVPPITSLPTINVALLGLVKAGSPFATMRAIGIVAVFPTPLTGVKRQMIRSFCSHQRRPRNQAGHWTECDSIRGRAGLGESWSGESGCAHGK